MDVFTTKIKLNSKANADSIMKLLSSWLIDSPHYNIDSIDYNGEENFSKSFGDKTLQILSLAISTDSILALRFKNPEEHNVWITDCIYIENSSQKRISISLSCHSNDYSRILPRTNKPHIIKKIIESGLCETKDTLPISDEPIYLTKEDCELCSNIMNGLISTPLPVVYLSADDFNPEKYSADEKSLAIKLSGIAHVLAEPDKQFSKNLKTLTGSKNPYNGYIGLYFSNSLYREIISFEDFYVKGILDRKKVENAICRTVKQAVLNRDNTNDYSWNKLQIAYQRSKYESENQNAISARQECDDFIAAFDADIKEKDDKISDLQIQLEAKNSIIESLRAKNDIRKSIIFSTDEISEFYNGELNDLIIHLLSEIKRNSGNNMTYRQKELLDIFLKNNKEIGAGRELMKEIEKALKEKSLTSRRSMLAKCGFTLEKGSHDKAFFHTPKYSFTLANSPSEHRGDENMLSDIKRRIDIYKKI